MRTAFVLTLLLATSVSLAQQPKQPNAQQLFERWDRDKSGGLSKEELPPAARGNFERADRDKDGSISPAEHKAFLASPRPGGGRLPEGIRKLVNLDYAGNENPRQKLDLYLPKEKDEKPLPVIVWIHGGGWQKGSKEGGGRLHSFVESGKFAGVSVGYRLSDEAIWPAQIHDCKAAIRWIRANAKEHGLDPDRVAVWGSSAGGHLVTMLGTTHGVEELEGKVGPHLEESSEVRAVVNFYGPADLLKMNEMALKEATLDHDAPNSPESKMLGGTLQEVPEKAKGASPIYHVSEDDEPSLIVHGTRDLLVPYPQSIELEKKLEAVGVKTILLTVEGGGHGGGFPPEVNEFVGKYLENALLGAEHDLKDTKLEARVR